MKHAIKVTLLLALLFLMAQFIGLAIVGNYTKTEIKTEGNLTYKVKTYTELPYKIQRPEFEEETSFIPIFAIILIATLIALIILKFGFIKLWKLWFFLSIWFCLVVAIAAFLPQGISMLAAFILALIKTIRRSLVIHNLTELFIYGGLAAVFVPVFNILSISIFLILISIYDMIAVWRTKHMVQLAKFQAKLKLFAGLLIPYGPKREKTAILGGGDIGFPLIFAAVVMKTYGLLSLIVPIFTTLALLILLFKGEKNKFYPAMPFLSAGCFVGFLVLKIISIM